MFHVKQIRYKFEFLGLFLLLTFFRIFPWRLASRMGGAILGLIGPRLAASRKAKRNIAMALPDLDTDSVVTGMWAHLGRVLAEYPHLKTIAANHTVIEDPHGVLDDLRDDGQPAILFSAHIGNWEVMPMTLLGQKNLTMHPVYRAPNNPDVDRLLHNYRTAGGQLTPYDKSHKGMIGLTRALTAGQHIGMLIDQKYNEGVEADFFGHPAMTSTAFIELCQRFDCPLVPGHIIRDGDGFRLQILPPLDTNRPVEDVLGEAHRLMEGWIRETPEQWLWLHRRWKDEAGEG